MKRIWIVLLVVAVSFAVALPVGAKKPDKSDNPNKGFKPMACEVVDKSGDTFILNATELGGFNETRYTVATDTADSDDVLCVEVSLLDGTLSDLRVRWMECQDPCLYRLGGKDLRNFNNGAVFSAGVRVADLTDPGEEWTVAVMPVVKSGTATMTVKIGIGQP